MGNLSLPQMETGPGFGEVRAPYLWPWSLVWQQILCCASASREGSCLHRKSLRAGAVPGLILGSVPLSLPLPIFLHRERGDHKVVLLFLNTVLNISTGSQNFFPFYYLEK